MSCVRSTLKRRAWMRSRKRRRWVFFCFDKWGERRPCPAASRNDARTSPLSEPSGSQGHFAAKRRRRLIFKVVKVAVFMSQLSLPPSPSLQRHFPKAQPKPDRRAIWKTSGGRKDSLSHSSEQRLTGGGGRRAGPCSQQHRETPYFNTFDLLGASAQKAKGGDCCVKYFCVRVCL